MQKSSELERATERQTKRVKKNLLSLKPRLVPIQADKCDCKTVLYDQNTGEVRNRINGVKLNTANASEFCVCSKVQIISIID
jgi:hypothetical protein